MKKITLKISGIHCESCAKTVEKALLKEKGVVSATVSFSLGKATIDYDPEKIDTGNIKRAIKKMGYEAQEKEGEMKDEIKKAMKASGLRRSPFFISKEASFSAQNSRKYCLGVCQVRRCSRGATNCLSRSLGLS